MFAEAERLRRLKRLVDATASQLVSDRLDEEEKERLVRLAREAAERLIPDQMALYDQIYGRRFARLREQFPGREGRP